MTRYERLRNQNSRIWRKRRAALKVRIKAGNMQANTPKIKGGPDHDLISWRNVPLMTRVMIRVREALAKKDYQRAQAR